MSKGKSEYGKTSVSSKKLQKSRVSLKKNDELGIITEFSENYDFALDALAQTMNIDLHRLVDYLGMINFRIEEIDMDHLKSKDKSTLFEPHSDKKTTYELQTQLTELMGMILPLWGSWYEKGKEDKDETEEEDKFLMDAADFFVESYKKQRRHVSIKNPTLEEQFEKVEYFRSLEDFTEGVEGIGRCTICGGTKIIERLRQTRSADEAATFTRNCANCQASGRYIIKFKEKDVGDDKEEEWNSCE
jgi:DNA-directed RNA polymerase subunit M/transcription elongation factor TFIIS